MKLVQRFQVFVAFVILLLLAPATIAWASNFDEILLRAKRGDHNAQSYIGHCYLCGKGVDQNPGQARYWYQKVIDQPGADAKIVAHANLIMGMLYRTGRGGQQSFRKALKCFKIAAAQGFTDAHINIGLMYAKGLGVTKNYQKALYWWQLAAEMGHPTAPKYVVEVREKIAVPQG